MALGAFYSWVSALETFDIGEDALLTKSMAALDDSVGESIETETDVTLEHVGQLLRTHGFLNFF